MVNENEAKTMKACNANAMQTSVCYAEQQFNAVSSDSMPPCTIAAGGLTGLLVLAGSGLAAWLPGSYFSSIFFFVYFSFSTPPLPCVSDRTLFLLQGGKVMCSAQGGRGGRGVVAVAAVACCCLLTSTQ